MRNVPGVRLNPSKASTYKNANSLTRVEPNLRAQVKPPQLKNNCLKITLADSACKGHIVMIKGAQALSRAGSTAWKSHP